MTRSILVTFIWVALDIRSRSKIGYINLKCVWCNVAYESSSLQSKWLNRCVTQIFNRQMKHCKQFIFKKWNKKNKKKRRRREETVFFFENYIFNIYLNIWVTYVFQDMIASYFDGHSIVCTLLFVLMDLTSPCQMRNGLVCLIHESWHFSP